VPNIVKSLIITIVVSVSVSWILWYVFDYEFIKSVVITTLIQFIFFAIYNNIKRFISDREADRELTTRIAEFNKQAVDAPCAYCGVTNHIPIRLDQDNNFICQSCEKTSAVYISLTTAQKTQMTSADRLNISSILTDKIKDEIKNQ
jgi:hypothetical protein